MGNGGHTMIGRRGPTRQRRYAARLLVGALALAIAGCGPGFGSLAAGSGSGAAPKTTSAAAVSPASSNTLTGWLHTSGSKIEDASNHVVTIRAVNWFGLETSNCAPHGLWTISLDTALAQIRSFGFNAIRLPYANQCLDPGATTSGIDFNQNPKLAGKSPLQVMDAVINAAAAYGLKVILDQHRPDTGAQSELWYTARYPEARWLSDWRMLAARYRNNSTVIGADLHNEPHGSACWGCGNPALDWRAAATRGGNAVLAANPHLLILVEGIDHESDGTYTWWGGGLLDARARPVVLSSAGHLVYSPHDYPASVYAQSWFSAPNYPANLPGVWDHNWGFLAESGTAPVLLGEFGTKLQTTSDKQWLATLVSYLQRTGMSFAYWDYNPNSGDTGGLVKDDWRTPESAKLAALKPILGPATPAPVPPPAPTPKPTPPPAPTPKPTPPVTTAGSLSASWQLQSSWQSGTAAFGYVAQIVVTSTSAQTGWSLSWADPGAKTVVNSWGMTCHLGGGRITCAGSGWGAALSAHQPVTVGLQVGDTSAGPAHPALTISGS